jgi:hypothetical protein
MKPNYIEQILGTADVGLFSIWVGIALFGAAVSLRLNVAGRDRHSNATPVKFNWSFFLQDNLQRFINTLMVILPCIRFANEFLGTPATAAVAFGIGLGTDRMALLLKNINKKARK